MDNFTILKIVDRDTYKKYTISGDKIYGRIVLEKYGDVWNLELMNVMPTGRGYGTAFLGSVLHNEGLNAGDMTVCPMSEGSRRFFERNGFFIG